jgi:hypothetical protein
MPHSPCVIDDVEVAHLPINLTNSSPNLQEEIQSSPNLTQKAMKFHNLLSLPHLRTRLTIEKKPLVNYSQSHIVTSTEYLIIS